MNDKDSSSSSDEIAVFQAYASLINSERETLWARHNALLLANSLIMGALAISPAALWENKWAALAMLSAGLLISAVWASITVQAWSSIRRHADLAGTFASTCFNQLPNPFAETVCNRWRHGQILRLWRAMNGSVGSSRPKRQKQERAGSNGAVPASETESEDPVVGLAVRIVDHCESGMDLQAAR